MNPKVPSAIRRTDELVPHSRAHQEFVLTMPSAITKKGGELSAPSSMPGGICLVIGLLLNQLAGCAKQVLHFDRPSVSPANLDVDLSFPLLFMNEFNPL